MSIKNDLWPVKFGHFMMFSLAAALLMLSMAAGAGSHSAGEMGKKDIVDIAAGNDDFKTLVAALKAAGLVKILKGKGPFTVFAPTDAAFDKLPAGTVESLLKPENIGQLKAVLTYHVVAARVTAKEVVKLDRATTVNGADVSIAVTGNTVKINDASVVTPDIMASNGVIHVIDTVILPPDS